MSLHLLLGTTKGAFLLEGDAARRDWRLRGPFCEALPISHVIGDPGTGTIWAAGGTEWFGVGVWRSDDLGASWTRSDRGLSLGEEAEPLTSLWSLGRADGRLYAGSKPAALFVSEDGGDSWAHVRALSDHPTRDRWNPGGAGLVLHSIAADPEAPDKLWVGISSAGVFASEDAGASWEPRNRGTRSDFAPEDQRYPEFGQCVHSVARAPGPGDVMYQQNHCGMYRSADGGRSWQSIEAGLPSSFGFPVAVHPRDPETVWFFPLNGDVKGRFPPEGRARVWRSRDGGTGWQALGRGLPERDCYFTVLRQAMAADRGDPAGVYFGTNTGSVFASADEGDSWSEIARHLPTVLSVEVLHT